MHHRCLKGANMLTHLSLFTGVGGIDIAAEMAGIETVGQCEWMDYQTKVLEKHWPHVERWRDIHEITGDSFRTRTGIQSVDVISGGFPCQPFSNAGNRKGKADDRYLWPQMLRVIKELRPTWVVGENVAGLTTMVQFDKEFEVDSEGNAIGEIGEIRDRRGSFVLKEILESIEQIGYDVQPFVVPACGVGARHRRDRVFLVAHRNSSRRIHSESGKQPELRRQPAQPQPVESGPYVADTNEKRLQGRKDTGEEQGKGQEPNDEQFDGCNDGCGTWAIEPNVGRVANGVPNRVDRLKCLGNAVVPQQVYPIFKAIADIENGIIT